MSVDDAVAFVPRVGSLRQEYHRKVRTIARGLQTLFFKRSLMNPFRYGLFAWELISHKLVRWLAPWAGLLALAALGLLAPGNVWARWALGLAALGGLCGLVGWMWPAGRRMPRILATTAFLVAGNVAAIHAWIKVFRGDTNPTWEPTRRAAASGSEVV